MKLTLEQVRKIATGCESVTEQDGRFRFFRFTQRQYEAYYENPNFRMKCGATSGVTLSFSTDATALEFVSHVFPGSSRQFWYFDLLINGSLRAHVGMPDMSVSEKRFSLPLGDGVKDVVLYFPCLARTELEDIELDGDVKPLSYKHGIVFVGDSITQGYDAVYPSATYAARVSRMLDAKHTNQGIAAALFTPGAAYPVTSNPDIAVAAFGSNDWAVRKPFGTVADEFYEIFAASYPDSVKFAVTPIWVDKYEAVKHNGTWEELYETACALCEKRDITVIDGSKLTPHLSEFFTDGLHPNDVGFSYYAEAMVKIISSKL